MVEKGSRSSLLQPTYKESCMTCKIRKKKCSREHPICSDCKRLNKRCEWIDDTMTIQEIRELKEKVLQDEKVHRIKRKVEIQTKKVTTTETKKRKINCDNHMGEMLNGSCFNVLEFRVKPSVATGSNQKDNEEQKEKEKDTAAESEEVPKENKKIKIETIMKLDINRGDSPNSLSLVYQTSPLLTSKSLKYLNNGGSGNNSPLTNFLIESPSFLKDNYSANKVIDLEDVEQIEKDINKSITPRSRSGSPFFFSLDESYPMSYLDLLKSSSPTDPINHHESHVQIPQPTESNSFIPSPLPSLSLISYEALNLDETAITFYDYYRNHLSRVISIVPPESNFYVNLFLPMASMNPGVLYGILSWSAAHMGKGFHDESDLYMEKALDYIKSNSVKSDSDVVQKLANWLVLIAAELCRGDVTQWSEHMKMGAQVINDRGGLFSFNHDKNQHWLISNFVYHDTLRSSATEKGTYFPSEDYEAFMVSQLGLVLDPLQGLVRPLFNIIGEISTLSSHVKRLLESSSMIDHDPRSESLVKIMEKASILEKKIDQARPNLADLGSFSQDELELQFTLFEVYQYTAKLHLRQSVLRLNPSSLETQHIICEFFKCLDVVFGSSVDASLCFPLFIAGMNCLVQKDRDLIIEKFDDLIKRLYFRNIVRTKTITQKVWELDPYGTKCIDWYDIIKGLDWDLCFA